MNMNMNSKTNKIKMGIALASVSVLVIGGSTTFSLASFSSSNNNNINNDVTAAAEINLLRTSTTTNTAEAVTTLSPNCCNVADGIFKGGDAYLENCYETDCHFIGGCQYCWSKMYFKNGDSEECVPHGDGWYIHNEDRYPDRFVGEGECGSPCTSFASNTC